MKSMRKIVVILLSASLFGCGHASVSKVGLMSFGDLEGKAIPENLPNAVLAGSSCGGHIYISDAVRDALKETEYDTLVNSEVTSITGLFVFNNCIQVKGTPLNSKTLALSGGKP